MPQRMRQYWLYGLAENGVEAITKRMGWVELFLLASVLINWYQYGEFKELRTEYEITREIASACEATKKNARAIELQQADKRQAITQAARRVIAESGEHVRRTVEMDSTGCAGVVDRGSDRRMDSIIQRTKTINNQWLPATGTPADD